MDALLKSLPIFQPPPEDATLYIGLFSPWLVAAAWIVAWIGLFAVFSALNFARNNVGAISSPRLFQSVLGFMLGLCLWIMHFIGLIGYILPVPVAYDPFWTALSLGPVMMGGGWALWVLIQCHPQIRWFDYLRAGLLLAVGMILTHVFGISAIDLAGMVKADPQDVGLWSLGAWLLATTALGLPAWAARWPLERRTPAMIVSCGLAAGMSYAVHRYGMEITYFMTDPQADMVVEGYDPEWLASVIIGAAALMGTGVWLLFMRSFLRQIERSNLLLNQALELTHSGFWELDPDSEKMLLSEQAAKLFGLSDGKAGVSYPWRNWLQGVHRAQPEMIQECRLQLESLTRGEVASVQWTFPFQPLNQSGMVWINCVGTAVTEQSTRRKRFYFAVQDVTDEYLLKSALRQSKEEADAANKTKGEFLANMSHEIRTPMNAILGLTELALRQPMTPKLNDQLGKVHLAAKNLLGIINDILDLSKVESGKMELEITPYNLDDVLDNLSTVLATSIEEKGLELLFDRKPNVPVELMGDPLRLGQVLLNLCGNARKFTDHGSIVVRIGLLESSDSETRLQFEIIDSGIGMSQEQVQKLFQPFSQADASITRKYGGTGLGLAISKQLVELMGGKIGVESKPGAGSRFHFDIPLTPSGLMQESELLMDRLQGLKVLVVDDNPQAREILSAHLRHFHCEVHVSPSAEEAIPWVRSANDRQPFELILMDYRMPGINGLTAARQIRTELGLSKPPAIILVTAASYFDGHDEAAVHECVNEVLNKPVNASMLFDAIMNVLGLESVFTHKPANRKSVGKEGWKTISGASVLLVEDNPINQEVAKEFLAQAGLAVTIANHGAEALEILEKSNFDVVLMDVQMPVMDGYTATREIKKREKWRDLPVIAMTANVMTEDKKMAMDAGMCDHVSKPIVMTQLHDVLIKWVRLNERHIQTSQSEIVQAITMPKVTLPPDGAALNVGEALKMLGGNEILLSKLFKDFLESHGQDAHKFKSCVDEQRWSDAQRLIHTMKGIAGMLGARVLTQSSLALEQSFRQSPSLPNPSLMASWATDLAEVLAHLNHWQQSIIDPLLQSEAPKELMDATNREVEYDRLNELLKAFDPDVSEVANRLAMCDLGRKDLWEKLQKQTFDFDFDGAIATLAVIRRGE